MRQIEMVEKKEYFVKEFVGKIVVTLMDDKEQPAKVDEELPYVIYDENLEEIVNGTTKSNIIILELPVSKIAYVSLKGKFYDVEVMEI